jgi:lysophospholipase L1-like esterase
VDAAEGIAAIVRAIRRAPIEPGMPVREVLVVAPPRIQTPNGPIAPKFAGAETKSVGLAVELRRVTSELDCRFFDAGAVTTSSEVDGIHLDAPQHAVLGRSLADVVATLPRSGVSAGWAT